nr:DUF3305 domain-containing protein [Methylonatrum kenyense]
MTPHTTELTDRTRLPVGVVVGHLGTDPANRRWKALGVVVGAQFASSTPERRPMRSGSDGDLFLWTGFDCRLHPAHTDDYAYNLQGEQPGVYVIVRSSDQVFQPRSVTLSLDEAQNTDATDLRSPDDTVHTVPMPPEVYRWVEGFILDHHVPKRRKPRGKKRSKALFDAEVGDFAEDPK